MAFDSAPYPLVLFSEALARIHDSLILQVQPPVGFSMLISLDRDVFRLEDLKEAIRMKRTEVASEMDCFVTFVDRFVTLGTSCDNFTPRYCSILTYLSDRVDRDSSRAGAQQRL